MRIGLIIGLLGLVTLGLLSAGCGARKSEAVANANDAEFSRDAQSVTPKVGSNSDRQGNPSKRALTVLMDGAHSSIADPFVAVIRDAETYAALRAIVGQMPVMNSEFLRSNTIVAAFLGTRRTGGYSVSLDLGPSDLLTLRANSPASGVMTAQVITAPLKIISLPAASANALRVELGAPWTAALRSYRVTDIHFTVNRGAEGKSDSRFTGSISVMRYGSLATFEFALTSPGAKPQTLGDIVTGTVDPSGIIMLREVNLRWPLDSTRESQRLAGKFSGKFEDNEDRLNLTFASTDASQSEFREANGQIRAVATGPAPPKSRVPDID